MSPRFHALPIALITGASCLPAASLAQSTPAPATAQPAPSTAADTIRLTDEQRRAILEGSTEESAAAARGELTANAGRGIHGEVGAMVGSHGTRSIYGVADIPLGDNAGATVMFESSRFGYRR